MTNKTEKITIAILCCLLLIACSNTPTPKDESNVTQEIPDTIQTDFKTQLAESDFQSYFSDIILGKDGNNNRKLIPSKIAAGFFPYFTGDADQVVNEKLYAIAKIIGYKGFDLYICDHEGERPDEDTYDNHTDSLRYLILYKDGKSLMEKEDPQQQLTYILNSHYSGEGGESRYLSYFDKDTTIVSDQYSSESESATGYSTPLNSTKIFRSKLNKDGELKITEVMRMEFSSPFYQEEYLKENDIYWKESEQKKLRDDYPTKESKWNLEMTGTLYSEFPNLFIRPINLYFYNERINGEMKAIFESYRNEQFIDRYILGQNDHDTPTEKDYSARTKILKCPIIIKTSDGDIELLPNGIFVRR